MTEETRAERVIDWIQTYLTVPDGILAGEPIELLPFQREFTTNIYDNPFTTRQAICSLPKKNGKTGFSACLLLAHLGGPEAKPNQELYSTANSKEQAAITFQAAAKMILMSPQLTKRFEIYGAPNFRIVYKRTGSFYRALSADKTTAQGLKPAFLIHDELGQVEEETSELYETLEHSMSTQAHPLSIVISTQAPTDACLLSQLIDDARARNDPRTVLALYEVPAKDEVFPPSDKFSTKWWRNLRKANPALGVFQNKQELWDAAHKAKRMTARETAFRNYVANQRVDTTSPFISKAAWMDCQAKEQYELTGAIYFGLDLAATSDLTALTIVSKNDADYFTKQYAWLPDDGLADRTDHGVNHNQYVRWRDNEYLRTIPGEALDYADLAEELLTLFRKYSPRQVAYDPYNWTHLEPRLRDVGMQDWELAKFVPFPQTLKHYTPALRELETLVLNKRLHHDGNPVLAWCMGNAVVQGNDEGVRKLSKHKSRGRIDCAVALAMAIGIAAQDNTPDLTGKDLITVWN